MIEEESSDLYVPMEFSLPAAITKCEKCGNKQGSRTYHKVGYLEGICGRTLGYPQIETLGEHIDRKCFNCGHEWCEQISPFGLDDEED